MTRQSPLPGLRLGPAAPALVAVLSGWGCGGETVTGTNGAATLPYDPCTDSQTIETVMVADFENAPLPAWNNGNDGTPGAVISANALGRVPEPLDVTKCPGDAPGSGFHVVATGLQAYGYTFSFNGLNNLPGAGGDSYFDTTNWDGISMWVRKGSATAASSMFAAVGDRFTDPAGAALFSAADDADLLPAGSCPEQSMGLPCYCAYDAVDVTGDQVDDPLASQCDKFGAGVGVSTEWRFFKVPFTKMRQRAFGRPSPLPNPDTQLIVLDFSLRGINLDFWIDDLAFYRDTAGDAVSQ